MPNLTGMKNLEILASLQHKIGKERIQEVLQTVGLDPKLKKPVSKYSLGMRQRLGIAQAVMEDPSILILDEPTRGVDVGAKAEIYAIMNELVKQGMSIIMISSELPEIINMSDRIYVMNEGRVTGCLDHDTVTQESIMTLAAK